MAMLNVLDQSLLSLEQLLASAISALGPVSNRPSSLDSPLDVAQLERRILLSGAPPGGGELIQQALSGPDPDTQQAAVVENNLPEADSQTIVIDPSNRMIAWHSIAHSSPDQTKRLVGGGLTENGWGPFIEDTVMTDIAAGFTRIELHNPFGRGADDRAMAFDQYLGALVETPKLTENFAELWRPITDSGIEVIAYIGSPRRDPDQVALLGDPAAWWDRALACVQPLVDAGMSIGLDAAAPALPDSMDAALAEYLESQGVRVYIEARPRSASPQWFDNSIIIRSDTWDRQAPELHTKQIGKHAWDYQLTGEVVRLVDRDDSFSGNEELIDVLADGHTAAVRPAIVHAGPDGPLSLDEFLSRLNLSSLPTEINLRASDADGDALTYTIVSGPSHGTLSVHPNNSASLLYTPDAYYSGTDSFSFQVNDGTESSQVAVVSLTVHGFTPGPDWVPDPPDGGPGDDVPPPPPPVTPPSTTTPAADGLELLAGHMGDPLLLRGHSGGFATLVGTETALQPSLLSSPTMDLTGSQLFPRQPGGDYPGGDGRHRFPATLDRWWGHGLPASPAGRVEHVESARLGVDAPPAEPLERFSESELEDPVASQESETPHREEFDPDRSGDDAVPSRTTSSGDAAAREEDPPLWFETLWNMLDWEVLRRLVSYLKPPA